MFGLFKKKDPICGMKEETGSGIKRDGNWFCSYSCLKEFQKSIKTSSTVSNKKGCC